MAEQFIEEIYSDAKAIDDLRESVACIARTDYYNAKIALNRGMSRIEAFLEKYAVTDASSAEKVQNYALDIINSWGNWSYMTGGIRGKLIPALYEYMSYFNTIEVQEDNYLLKSTDSGFLTLKDVGQDMFLHDVHDPMQEADDIAGMLYSPWAEKYILFGCGLGYLPYKLWIRSGKAAQIIVFEDDENIIDYAMRFGVLEWIEKESLDIRYEADQKRIIEKFYSEIDLRDKRRVSYITPYKKKKFKNSYDGKFLALAYRIEHMWVSYGINETNLWKNRNLRSIPFKKLREKIECDSWIVVAAGPSLNYSMEFIKKNANSAKIVAVNTVLRRFAQESVVPDLSVAADPFGQIPEHLDGIEEYTANIPMVADWLLNWQYAYRYQGEKCFVPTPAGECIQSYNSENEDVWDVFGTVSAMAIEAAIRLGGKMIYLVGLDLAFPGGEVHAKNMPHDKVGYKSESIMVPSMDGGMVETTAVFNDFRSGIEEIIGRNPNIEFFNMSKEGAVIKGAKSGWEE